MRRYNTFFFKPYSITVLFLVLMFSNVLANDGNTWLELSEGEKETLIAGYSVGVIFGADSAIRKAQRLYDPIPQNKDKDAEAWKAWINSPESDRRIDDFLRIRQIVSKEEGLRHDISSIVKQMDFLYKDPATRVIRWFFMLGIAQDRLDGKDVSSLINGAINSEKSWDSFIDDTILKSKKSK